MLTFKSNYAQFGQIIGVDLVTYPDRLLSDMTMSARVAGAFWTQREANRWADVDNLDEVTKLINGGENGEDQRAAILSRLKTLWGLS